MRTITTVASGQWSVNSDKRSRVSGLWSVLSVVRCPLSTVVIACCLLAPALSFAAFENQDAGARQSGLGDACTALGGDVHSLFHNPAGLAYLNRKEFSSSYSRLFTGLDDNSNIYNSQFIYGQPTSARGSLGFGWLEMALDDLYRERTLSAGYGHLLKDNLAIGASLKQLRVTQEAPPVSYNDSGSASGAADPVFANGNSAAGIGADLGVLYEPTAGYSLGLSLQNINQPKVSLADPDRVPALVRLGLARRTPSLLIASELRSQEAIRGVRDYQAALGAEMWLRQGKNSSFALRGSLAYGSRKLRQFALGLGYRVTDIQMDYAFQTPLGGISFGDTGGTHRLSLSMRFGGMAARKISWTMGGAPVAAELEETRQRTAKAEERVQALQEQIKKLQVSAPAQLSSAPVQTSPAPAWPLPAKPKPAAAFKAKAEIVKISTDPAKAQELFREGMRFYSGRQLEKAVGAFRESLEFNPENKWAKKALERTLAELEQEKTQQKPAPQEIRYTVRGGDTLWNLARKFYGDPGKWTLIRDANPKIKDLNKLSDGTVLVIPRTPELGPAASREDKP